MSWLFPAVSASLISSVLLSATYWAFYYSSRQKYLKLWSISWGVYSLRFLFTLLMISFGKTPILYFSSLCATLLSMYLLYLGTLYFIEKKMAPIWQIAFIAIFIWTGTALLADVDFFVTTLPLFAFNAFVDIWLGYLFLKSNLPDCLGKTLVGLTFFVWGLHKADYPFLGNVEWFAPYGFLLGALCSIIIAFGMLLLYLKKSIEELQGAKEDLRVKNEILQKLTSSAKDAIIQMDGRGRTIFWNDAATAMFGFSETEVLGRSLHELLAPNNSQTKYREAFPGFQKTGEGNAIGRTTELLACRKDGASIPVELSLSAFKHNSEWQAMAIVRDISGRKEEEAARIDLQHRAAQAQKMESLGVLAGGIAHDFNNVLSAIFGYLHIAIMRSNEPKVKKYLLKVEDASRKARDLVKQILSFSRDVKVETEDIFVEPIVTETMNFLKKTLPSSVKVRYHVEDPKLAVHASPIQINQIIMNLVTNACHAMEEKNEGTLTVALSSCQPAAKQANQIGIGRGPYVCLQVEDTGMGIAKDLLPKIFDPFFTTKAAGKGTGLGLSIIHSTLEKLRGGCLIESEEGQGTTFRIYLPQVEKVRESQNTAEAENVPGSGNILLVDDEVQILDSLSHSLKICGYQVRSLSDPYEAKALVQRNPDEFDLVITDQTMPSMSGIELSRALHAINASLPIILYSGFLESAKVAEARETGVKLILDKPIEMFKLSSALKEILKV